MTWKELSGPDREHRMSSRGSCQSSEVQLLCPPNCGGRFILLHCTACFQMSVLSEISEKTSYALTAGERVTSFIKTKEVAITKRASATASHFASAGACHGMTQKAAPAILARSTSKSFRTRLQGCLTSFMNCNVGWGWGRGSLLPRTEESGAAGGSC